MDRILPKKISWTQKFGSIEIVLTIIGAILCGIGPLLSMGEIDFFTGTPFVFIAISCGILFGPWVGGLAGLIALISVSVMLGGGISDGIYGEAVGIFLAAFIPGVLVPHPKNWKSVVLWGGIVGTLIAAICLTGWLAILMHEVGPAITLFTFTIIISAPFNLLFTPIACAVIFPLIQKKGLYWRDRLENIEE